MGQYNCASILLKMGADPSIQNNCGETPLHQSVENKNVKISNLLIEKGCNINAKTINGETCVYVATKQNDSNMVNTLLY